MKQKIKHIILITLSFLILSISFIGFWTTNEKRKIDSEGFEVFAEVIYYPENCSTIYYRYRHCKLKYNDKIFIKDIDLKMCDFISDKNEIKMLTNEKGTRLMFEEEYEAGDFIFSFFLLILACLGIRQGFKGIRV